jgi:NAD(P)-dependent dehydrogenase (short-subunit alcohol dehydrogenase family)
MLGSAPYSVTKHAAVAFAEWLSATYGHRGIVVQALCPQGVRTGMLERIAAESALLEQLLSRDTALEPEQVADAVWQALADDRFLILPHPQVADYYAQRATDTDRWLAGMRRLQARLDEAGVRR